MIKSVLMNVIPPNVPSARNGNVSFGRLNELCPNKCELTQLAEDTFSKLKVKNKD